MKKLKRNALLLKLSRVIKIIIFNFPVINSLNEYFIGTFLIGNAGVLLSSIQDMTSTGSDGYNFLKLDSGMTEVD